MCSWHASFASGLSPVVIDRRKASGYTRRHVDPADGYVGVVVDGLAGAIASFAESGLELEGETLVEGRRVDRVMVSTVLEWTSQRCGPGRRRPA